MMRYYSAGSADAGAENTGSAGSGTATGDDTESFEGNPKEVCQNVILKRLEISGITHPDNITDCILPKFADVELGHTQFCQVPQDPQDKKTWVTVPMRYCKNLEGYPSEADGKKMAYVDNPAKCGDENVLDRPTCSTQVVYTTKIV